MDQGKIGYKIAAARKKLNLTQKELAKAIGISDRAVSKWERGFSYPEIELLQPISEILNLSLAHLISGEKYTEHTRDIYFDSDLIRTTVEIAKNELKRKKRKYFKITLVMSICVTIIIGVITLPFQFQADSMSKVYAIKAQAFPSNNTLSIPISTRTNMGDFYAYGSMWFSSRLNFNRMEEKIIEILGKNDVTKYSVLGGVTGSRLLITQPQDDGTIDYYALISTGIDDHKTKYILTGMRYQLDIGLENTVNIILPTHMISDIRIGASNSKIVISGTEYELNQIRVSQDEYKDNYVEMFYDFYSSIGWYDATKTDDSILLKPKPMFTGAIEYSIKFIEHSNQTFFSVVCE